jgi:hypothetical protein
MTDVILERRTGEQALAMMEDIADLYMEAHSGNPGESDELFSRSSFVTRTSRQARGTGFELIAAIAADVLVGFSFGYPFSADGWWAGCTPPPEGMGGASKFAVIELDVLQTCQGRGLGKKLLEELLAGRAEDFATLAATPGSQAHAMYLRWGWHKVGSFEEAPVMDALAIPLSG